MIIEVQSSASKSILSLCEVASAKQLAFRSLHALSLQLVEPLSSWRAPMCFHARRRRRRLTLRLLKAFRGRFVLASIESNSSCLGLSLFLSSSSLLIPSVPSYSQPPPQLKQGLSLARSIPKTKLLDEAPSTTLIQDRMFASSGTSLSQRRHRRAQTSSPA